MQVLGVAPIQTHLGDVYSHLRRSTKNQTKVLFLPGFYVELPYPSYP